LDPGQPPAKTKSNRTQKSNLKKTGDLLVARNPKNAYPLYLLMQKTRRFTKAGLLDAMENLLDSDRLLKSSAQNPKLVLEQLIMRLCGSNPR
jgi:DNA polymerase-3 subunit delta